MAFYTVLPDRVATVRQDPWNGVLSVIAAWLHQLSSGGAETRSTMMWPKRLHEPHGSTLLARRPHLGFLHLLADLRPHGPDVWFSADALRSSRQLWRKAAVGIPSLPALAPLFPGVLAVARYQRFRKSQEGPSTKCGLGIFRRSFGFIWRTFLMVAEGLDNGCNCVYARDLPNPASRQRDQRILLYGAQAR